MSTLSESRPAPVGVLLRFDGVVHSSDLPVQSFARHLTDALPTDQVRAMIAGMRGFLEGKPELIPAGIDLAGAEDGYQAVELLGRAAGLTDAVIAAAYRASRADLAASAWAVDESDGLDELLAALDGRVSRAVFTEPDDPAASAVLDSIGIMVDDLGSSTAPRGPGRRPSTRRECRPAADSRRRNSLGGRTLPPPPRPATTRRWLIAIGWVAGTPTLRSPDVAGLVEPIRRWCAEAGHRISTVALHE